VITTKTRFQLLLFAIIAVLGVSYVGVHYVGLGQKLRHTTYTVSADFTDGGGIYPGADVTYNGVHVGKVGKMQLLADGVRVQLIIDKSAPRIPATAGASVNDRSAVGEQYVDLRPAKNSSTYLADGSIIPMNRNSIPISTPRLLLNVDQLVNSVDRSDLSTVIDELGKAFAGRGQDLQRLIDEGNPLLSDAQKALPQTLSLLDVGKTVLDTQVRSKSDIASFSKNLRLLSAQLKSSDPDLRRLVQTGPAATNEVNDLLTGIRTDTGVLLANLLTTSQVTTKRLAGVEQILAVYPAAVAGGFTVVPGDGTAHFGLAVNLSDPPACEKGYESTTKRAPADGTDTPANTAAGCTEPKGSGTDVRGAQNAPIVGGPEPVAPIPSYARAHESPQPGDPQDQPAPTNQAPHQPTDSGSAGASSGPTGQPSSSPSSQVPSDELPIVPGLGPVTGIRIPTIPGLGS
jgi:phospholipid/cholesterol/gamma-HCH transport system substrate-binding protein